MSFNSILRPNYRRARALKMELDAVETLLAQTEPSDTELIEDLTDQIAYLRQEFETTGVTSEYDL